MKGFFRVVALTTLIFASVLASSVTAAPEKKASSVSAPKAVKTESTALKPEVLGVKAYLEELLVRRYSQELSTIVDRGEFSLGSRLELAEIPKEAPKKIDTPEVPDDTPPDFLLGTLDPEKLLKEYAGSDVIAEYRSVLRNYRINGVTISVGLKADLSADAKNAVEQWLNNRLSAEFGGLGKSVVSFVQSSIEKPAVPKGPLDWLNQFQTLAGQIVVALAILLGALLWMLSGGRSVTPTTDATSQASPSVGGSGTVDGETKSEVRPAPQDETKEIDRIAANEAKELKRQLVSLAPKLSNQCEPIMRAWCQAGDDGRMKLACFAETMGKELGKLPIPVDALSELSKVFSRMPEIGIREKRDSLRKAYWDVLMAINLGSETLLQPFAYLGGLNISMVNQILMDQNPKMKALVTFYMPSDLRASYLKSMNRQEKLELISTAAGMDTIGANELKSLDRSFKGNIVSSDEGAISLTLALSRIIASLSPIDEITLLADLTEMNGKAFEEFKRIVPSLAFLGSWQDDSLSILLSQVTVEELVGLLRVRKDLEKKLLVLCPPMTADMASDELSRPDATKEADRNQHLSAFTKRLRGMVERREISLDEAFGDGGVQGAGTDEKQNDKKLAA